MSTVPSEAIAPIAREALVGDRARASQAPIEMPRGWLMRRLLLMADVIGLMSAFLLALAVGPASPVADRVSGWWELALFAASLPLWVFLARAHSLYDRDEERSDHSTVDDIFGVFQVVTIGTWSFLAITHLAGLPHPTLPRLVIFWLTAVVLVPLLRAATRIVGRRHPAYVQNVIIVGSGDVAQLLDSKIRQHPEYRLKVVGFVDGSNGTSSNGAGHARADRSDRRPSSARSLTFRASCRDRVLCGLDERTLEVIRELQDCNVQVDIVPRLFEVLGTNAQFHTIEGVPLVGLADPSPLALVEVPQAIARPRRRDHRARCARTALCDHGAVHQAGLAGAGLLPPGAHGCGRAALPRLQVPDHGRRR